jgi:uncharacterized membrane protein YdjX (TVP38/TMEM64 family)
LLAVWWWLSPTHSARELAILSLAVHLGVKPALESATCTMRTATRLLALLTLAAIAVPLVPFLVFGTRLDHLVADWLDPRPTAFWLATAEIGILAIDFLLPVPSSVVATLGGAELGLLTGTLCGWLGMTAGAAAGWWLGRVAGGRSLAGLAAEERLALERQRELLGPLLVVVSRPLPLVAEAAAILAGSTAMPLAKFLPAAAAGNLAVAFAWSLAGAVGARADAMQWVLLAALAIPVAAALAVVPGRAAGR